MTRERVVAAALTVLRAEGLGAVSMRRVAAELGVAPNALYSHVPDKAALLDGLLDAVLADVAVPGRRSWRSALEVVLGDTRRVLLAHPDLVPHFLSRQSTGPNALRLGEAVLAELHRGGVTGERAVRALQVLLVHTIGAAAFEVPRAAEPDPAGRVARARTRAREADPARHPHVTALSGALARHPGDAVFALGLRWLLDGLAAEGARA